MFIIKLKTMDNTRAGLDKLKSFVNTGDIAMLCTLQEDHIHCRPMATSDLDEEGNLWFFTNEYSTKVDEVEENSNITLCYTDHDDSKYICINGIGEIITDRAKMEELFDLSVKTYFPQGLNDPKLALLKVVPKHAEYWDSQSSSMIHFMGLLGSSKAETDEHGEVDL